MTEPTLAIELLKLSKTYRIPRKGRHSLRGTAAVVWDALVGGGGAHSPGFAEFSALQDFDLNIAAGESVAIVGRNGSGKSTLLQLIAGTLQPSSGAIQVNGRVSALLELGSGFNPDFTGRENVFLNGTIMGLDYAQIEAKLDDILAFADIGEFIDQPVRTYSSGMSMRLAFAVLTAVDPEILIVDEALSVGDAFFQSRCVRWLEDYVARGKTFICVSHDMFLIQRLCRRGIVLHGGRKMCDAPIAEAVNLYYRMHWSRELQKEAHGENSRTEVVGAGDGWEVLPLDRRQRTGDGRVTIEEVRTRPGIQNGCGVGEWVDVEVILQAHQAIDRFNFGFGFRDRSGQLIGGMHTLYEGRFFQFDSAPARGILRFRMKMDLRPQTYLLLIGAAVNNNYDQWVDLDCLWDCASLVVAGPEPFWGLCKVESEQMEWKVV